MPKPVIVVIGSINMDLVVRCGRVPKPGETIAGDELDLIPGGKGANQAVAAARLGGETYMVGRVGNDAFGDVLRRGLETSGVSTKFVKTTPGASGTAMILVQKGGENSIIISPGANGKVTRKDIDAALPVIKRASAVLLQLEIPVQTVKYAVGLCRKLKVRTILDPAPAPDRLPDALHAVSLITPNETEAATILRMKKVDEQAICRQLLSRGATDVVLKLGKRGALHANAHSHVTTHVKGFRVDPVDTTAAGDSFTAGLAVALGEGKSFPDALRFANAAGALACTRYGAQPSIPTRAAVMRMVGRSR